MTTASATASENQTATPENEAVLSNDQILAKHLDDFGRILYGKAAQEIATLNNAATRVKAASGDELAIMDDLRANYTEDDDTNNLRSQIDTIKERLAQALDAMDARLKPVAAARLVDAAAGGEQAKADYDAANVKVKASLKYLETNYHKDVLKTLPDIEKIKGGSSASANDGTPKRVRGYDVYSKNAEGIFVKITGKDPKGVVRSNNAYAAKALGVPVDVLTETFMGAAGAERDKWPAEVSGVVMKDNGAGNDSTPLDIKWVRVETNANMTETVPAESETPSE